MKIFMRTFNDKINSKTGNPLPDGQYRGTPEWKQFERILINCLEELGCYIFTQPEHPSNQEPINVSSRHWKKVYVHQTKRDRVDGDLFWMQMHMKELFTVDSNGWGVDHSQNNFKPGDVDAEEAKSFCEAKSRELLQSGLSKCVQSKETSQTPENFILVPLQIPRDYTIKHHSPITVRYFVDSIMAWAEESQNHICIKMHPHNKMDRDLHDAVDEGVNLSEYVHKVEGNIHELIWRSRGLFVINSGTGFEALIHGRAVATFGRADYSQVSFNADLRRINEACDFIGSYKPEWRELGYQFVHWYWHRHGYDVNLNDTPSRLTEYLKGVL